MADLPLSAEAVWDDWRDPGLAERVGVVALVPQHVEGATHAGEQLGCGSHVGDVAWREHQRPRAAGDVREGVDLGRFTTPRTANRLRPSPPFPPNAERWPLMYVLPMAVLPVTAPASTGRRAATARSHALTNG